MPNQRSQFRNTPTKPYHGEEIWPINRMHCRQQIHKYNLGLFITGIVAMTAAFITIVVMIITLVKYNNIENASPAYETLKTLKSVSAATTIIFVVTLGIDVVLTIMLNKYYKNKWPLILFIPALVLMVIFCVPELMQLIKLFIPSMQVIDIGASKWSSPITITICGLFIVFELIRMIRHRDELDIYKEVKKALR